MNPQCQLVLTRLERGPATSWELQQLGVCSHTARISDLRKQHYEIIRSEKRVRGRRIVTYTLVGQATPLPSAAPQNERVNGHDERVGECSNCHKPVYRKPKARTPLPGERLFCKQACHDAFWNGQKRQAELFTGIQQISTAFADARE